MFAVQVLAWLLLAVTQPSTVACPWDWEIRGGVREDGTFQCRPERTGCGDHPGDGECIDPPGELVLRVFCDAPKVAATSDGTRVFCRSRL